MQGDFSESAKICVNLRIKQARIIEINTGLTSFSVRKGKVFHLVSIFLLTNSLVCRSRLKESKGTPMSNGNERTVCISDNKGENHYLECCKLIPVRDPGNSRKAEYRRNIIVLLQKDASLPAFPQTLGKLYDLLQRTTVPLDEIAEIIKLDPSLAARLLQLVRSAAYGGKGITKLEDALQYLGFSEVRKLAALPSILNSFVGIRQSIDWDLFWFHSVLVARVTELIATSYFKPNGSEYLAGLMHDIGKLIMAQHFPGTFNEISIRSDKNDFPMFELEKDLLGITHADLSGVFCAYWGLGKRVFNAVIGHHEPVSIEAAQLSDPSQSASFLASCIYLADAVSTASGINIHSSSAMNDPAFWDRPEVSLLKEVPKIKPLELNMEEEIAKTHAILQMCSS
jgi:HD-like signal output (HDOD) protein